MAEEQPYVPWIAGGLVLAALAGLVYVIWPSGDSAAVNAADGGVAGSSPADGVASGGAPLPDGSVDPNLGLAWTAAVEGGSEASERVAVFARPAGGAPTLDSEAVVPVLQTMRAQITRCVRESAGEPDPDAPEGARPRATLAGADGGTGEPAMAAMNLDESGRVVARSFSLDAPATDVLRSCYEEAFAAARFPPPGDGGAFLRIRLD